MAGNDESQSSAADKPALTAVAAAVALEESLPQKETAAADADSVAQQAKQPEQDVSPVESPKVQPENNNNDGQAVQTAAATDAAAAAPTELMAAPVAEATVGQESGRTLDLQPTKTVIANAHHQFHQHVDEKELSFLSSPIKGRIVV